MGIRAQESITRHRAVTRHAVDNYVVKQDGWPARGNLWKAYPVYDWTLTDVWTAPALKGWDYNRAYDRMEMAGISRSIQRCSPAFGEEPLQKIHTYAACFPDVWAKMSERVPGVGAAVRYARTELYAYGNRPDKPAGVSWPEFIVHYLGKYEPDVASAVAGRIRMEMVRHYRKTTHPILPRASHPETGVSWLWLLAVAMRGDFKERRRPGTAIEADEAGRPLPKAWHRYAAELAAIADAGLSGDLGHAGPVPSADTVVPGYAREDAAQLA
jgi:predicted phosphoadenosine phosphosulfate sulfurtransferase